MTRLTNDIREAICKAAMRAAFDQKMAELEAQEAKLAKEAYDAIFPQPLQSAVSAIPANWFRKDSCLNFNVAGLRINLRTHDNGLPVPYAINNSRGYSCHVEIGVIAAGDLSDRIQANAMARDALSSERQVASRNLMAVLQGISSVKRLKEAWPEGEPFYSRFLDKAAPSLPAIRFSEINESLGISRVA